MTDSLFKSGVEEPLYFLKPERVQMFQWTGDIDQEDDPVWIVAAMRDGCAWHGNAAGTFWIADAEDRHWEAVAGDYILFDEDKDELWVVKAENFDKSYFKGLPPSAIPAIERAALERAALVCESMAHKFSDERNTPGELSARKCHAAILALLPSTPPVKDKK